MKMPKGLKKTERRYLKEVYEKTLSDNLKTKEKPKAKNVAKTRFYEEAFKIFLKKENINILEEWSNRPDTYIKEETSKKYKSYKVGSVELVASTDKKLHNDFSDAEEKGIMGKITSEFGLDIFGKVKEKYPDVKFDPDMYYVIKRTAK